MNRRQSTWMMHFIVLIFGFTGILGKLISLDAERLVFWRVLLGGGLVWLWLAVRGRVQRFPLWSLWKVALVGCTAAAHWIAFFASIKVSNVSVALATLATLTTAALSALTILNKLTTRTTLTTPTSSAILTS